MTHRTDDHAVVLGASMAGILAARVLADRYTRVTILERDRLPAVGVRRRGVPQDRHIHALQTRGVRAIESLFPGTVDELLCQGAVIGDWGRDTRLCFGGHRLQPVDAGLDMLAVSRPLLEGHLRARLVTRTSVRIRDGVDVRGLVLDQRRGAVTGVRVLPRRDGSTEERLDAALVVDATGRGSRLPQWLRAAGYEAPESRETGLEVTYTSCRFPRRPDDTESAILISAAPPGRRGGGAFAVEGDSWIVTLGGVQGEQAPTDIDGFVAWAATLPFPDLHELVRDREPLGDPVLMRYPTGRRLRYDRLERFPEGLAVLGDALCSFNPVYGQGMTVAASEALALGRALDVTRDRIGLRLLAECRQVVDDAWSMAAGGDARYVPPPGGPSRRARIEAGYQQRLLRVAAVDATVARAFCQVLTMVDRPASLLRPGIVARVLAGSRGRRASRGPAVRPRPTASARQP